MKNESKGVILIPFLTGYGGTETVIQNLLWEYNRTKKNYNIKLKLYSLGGSIRGNWLKFPNVSVIHYPKHRWLREFLYIFTLPILIFYILLKNKPSFVISTNPIIWSIAKVESELIDNKGKIIAWYHYSYKLKPINKYLLYKPDYYFTISKAGKEELENLNISRDKIFIIYNPVIPTKNVIRHSKYHNQFIYVGRLEYGGQKNIKELFKALSKLKEKIWRLRIYGVGPDKNKLIKLSKSLNIDNNIKWMGFIKKPFNHIKTADVLILTSIYEGFPMVLAESISYGLNVISSNCPDGPSELVNSSNGNLYNVGNVKELYILIHKILNGNISFNYNRVKNSISQFYIENYYNRLVHILNIIIY